MGGGEGGGGGRREMCCVCFWCPFACSFGKKNKQKKQNPSCWLIITNNHVPSWVVWILIFKMGTSALSFKQIVWESFRFS